MDGVPKDWHFYGEFVKDEPSHQRQPLAWTFRFKQELRIVMESLMNVFKQDVLCTLSEVVTDCDKKHPNACAFLADSDSIPAFSPAQASVEFGEPLNWMMLDPSRSSSSGSDLTPQLLKTLEIRESGACSEWTLKSVSYECEDKSCWVTSLLFSLGHSSKGRT